MCLDLKKIMAIGLLTVGSFLSPMCTWADPNSDLVNGGGGFGLGPELGDPGDWGVTGKFWIDREHALKPSLKFDDWGKGGALILQLDYLWNFFTIDREGCVDRSLQLYVGAGGNVLLDSPLIFAARVPFGVSYVFNKCDLPLSVYFQIVPTLWFYSGGNRVIVYPELGAHFYL
jgi:hypothetical protein